MRFFVAKLSAAPAASTGAPFTSELRCLQYAALLLESPYVLTFVYRVYENIRQVRWKAKKWGGGSQRNGGTDRGGLGPLLGVPNTNLLEL